jgi:myo-inositol-1(or 4)-monophosphatase
MSNIDIEELRHWLGEAGTIAKQHFKHVTGWRKADRSWVTEADQSIERFLGERLEKRYPNYGMIGEEQTRRGTRAEYLWVLDPIDGTASFVTGLPMWGISLGLLRDGKPHFGIIYMPLLDDCYWAGPEGHAYLNDRPIHVAEPRDWEREDWLAVPSNSHNRFDINFIGKTRSLGSIAAEFCYVARGAALGALISRAALWDVAAGLAILQAAGGTALTITGQPIDLETLIAGQPNAEPFLLGQATHVNKLQACIDERPQSKT